MNGEIAKSTVSKKLAVHLSVSAIARAALLVGLDIIEAQPGVLLGERPKRR